MMIPYGSRVYTRPAEAIGFCRNTSLFYFFFNPPQKQAKRYKLKYWKRGNLGHELCDLILRALPEHSAKYTDLRTGYMANKTTWLLF